MIGTELEKAQRDRLEEFFDLIQVSRSDQAINLLLQEQNSGIAFQPGRLPSSDRARDLQIRVDEVDEIGGELLDLDSERVSPLNLTQRLHLLEERVADGLLKLFGWSRTSKTSTQRGTMSDDAGGGNYSLEMGELLNQKADVEYARTKKGSDRALDIFKRLEQTEWDTLIFFYGVIMCVGGLGVLGYLELLSHNSFRILGANAACILIGLLSAIIDNIPMMYAVLSTEPAMSKSEWLLITLSAGVGGSLFAVGSAAGVGLMGVSHSYTFLSHLRWTPIVLVGYFASILAHFMVNGM